jgi:hypothetical protein
LSDWSSSVIEILGDGIGQLAQIDPAGLHHLLRIASGSSISASKQDAPASAYSMFGT